MENQHRPVYVLIRCSLGKLSAQWESRAILRNNQDRNFSEAFLFRDIALLPQNINWCGKFAHTPIFGVFRTIIDGISAWLLFGYYSREVSVYLIKLYESYKP